MRVLPRIALIAIVVAVLGVVTLGWLAVQDAPSVSKGATVSADDIRRTKSLLLRNDPRRGTAGEERTVSLSQQDATLLAQYATSRWRRASARVTLHDGTADVQASVQLPSNPLGAWLNVDATLAEAAGVPRIQRLRLGRLPIATFLAEPVLEWAIERVGSEAPVRMAREMVERTAFTPESMTVVYRWSTDATGRVRDMLIAPDEFTRLEAYHVRLSTVLAARPSGRSISLTELLPPMFALAAERADDGDPAVENKAAIATLALYVTGRRVSTWLRQAKAWPALGKRQVTLAGREDLAKHFLVSAVVVGEADRTLSDAVGLTKELDDSRGGSGFSFVDLAADRAGTRFGELAVSSAELLRAAVGDGVTEREIMPDIAGLPESMSAAQFAARFGGVGAPAYNAMMAVIEQRIAALPSLR